VTAAPNMQSRILRAGGGSTSVPIERALLAARDGAAVVVSRAVDRIGVRDEIESLYLSAIEAMASPAAAAAVQDRGLEHIHEVCDPPRIAMIIDHLHRSGASFAVPFARAIVELTAPAVGNRYFVCARFSARIMIPAALLDAHPDLQSAGHLAGHLRPASPHRDVDLTHPREALTMWAAVGPVRAENSLALFDDHGNEPLTPDLDPGDLLLFRSDHLHGSVTNTGLETRVAVTGRVVLGRRLRYGPGVYWRPYLDARLVDTPLAPLASVQSRCTPAAFRRWRWRREWERTWRRTHAHEPVPMLKR
jgi:hypothetical protein